MDRGDIKYNMGFVWLICLVAAMSGLLFGCIIGAVLSGALTDRFGRKRLLILSGLPAKSPSAAVRCQINPIPKLISISIIYSNRKANIKNTA